MNCQLPALKAELAALNERIEHARAIEIQGAIAQCRELIEYFGLTAYDLGLIRTQIVPPVKRVRRTFAPAVPHPASPPIFRDPATGETWNGRGSPPYWMNPSERHDYVVRAA
jgi:DNA-binding protein H-NS